MWHCSLVAMGFGVCFSIDEEKYQAHSLLTTRMMLRPNKLPSILLVDS
jgi:hypothetical protein